MPSYKNVTNVVWYILVQLSSLIEKIQSTKILKSQISNIKQITMTEIQNIKPVLVIEKLRFEIYL